jgi:prepilin-type N-terminal cleavage/methylation domain-containing protein
MKSAKKRGLSLVELSIVIAITGMMIAATVGGAQLFETAKIRRIALSFQQYQTAINQFRETYGYLPGDFPTASAVWNGDGNGDGDTLVEYSTSASGSPQEDLLLWLHLQHAKKIAGSYSGTNASGSIRYAADSNAPSSEVFSEAVYSVYTETGAISDIYDTTGMLIRLGALDENGYPFSGFLTAKQAYSVDKKIDDGEADGGFVYGVRGNGGSTCTNNAASSSSGSYSLSSTEKDCDIIFWLKKF